MGKILYLTNIDRRYAMMKKALNELQQEKGMLLANCECHKISERAVWSTEWETKLIDTDVLMLKWMGSGLDTLFLRKLVPFIQKNNIRFYIDAAGTEENELVDGLSAEDVHQIKLYALYNGTENYKNLWLFAAAKYSNINVQYTQPDARFWSGIYHPKAADAYIDLEQYLQEFTDPHKPYVGILFYRDEWIWGDTEYQKILIEELEQQGLNVICVFSNGMPIKEMGMPSLDEVFTKYFRKDNKTLISTLINCVKFSLTTSRSLDPVTLQTLNVPVLQAYTLLSEYDVWKNNLEGMNAIEISISVTLPEFDGVLHSLPIANKIKLEDEDIRYIPINERIVQLAKKAKKWSILGKKANKDKKVAIIFHNYPPRNSNIGSAVGLDTIESMRSFLKMMKDAGYKVDDIPPDGKTFINELTSNATNDVALLNDKQIAEAAKLSSAQYKNFFTSLPLNVQEQMRKDWGEAPGSVMNYDGDLLVPGMHNGNVFITVQPPRGFGEDPDKIYHSPFCAPTHQYLAFYYWLREIWQADVVIHVGTHGSLEWLPGKNAGLSNACYPDIALGDLPNLYIYLITITGEGIQAKRRGAACLFDHLPPPQSRAGVYDELEELEKLMDEYAHFVVTQPENTSKVQDLLLEKVKEANLEKEVVWLDEEPFADYAQKLHVYITDLKNMQVRTGLHILGQPPCGEQQIDYLNLLTRLSNGDVPGMPVVLALRYGLDYYTLLENSGIYSEKWQKTYGALVDEIGDTCFTIVDKLKQADFQVEKIDTILNALELELNEELYDELKAVCQYICKTVYPKLMLTTQETSNLLRGLNAEFIEPGPSGAPSSGGVDLLPTGRNFFGIDPRNLPTQAAWEIGKNLGDQVIERYIEEEGRYPESVGIVLWSGSNMRSHGQCLAEFLYLLGVRPIWQRGSLRVLGVEPIPLAELRRPRIDVTARISGLFRDAMPSAIQLLDKAVLCVAGLDEAPEDNYIRKHLLVESAELMDEGLSEEDAWRQAAFRIYGDEQGVYGAGVAALLEAKNWENIDDLADVYVRWGCHAYGGKIKGKCLPEQFRKRMGSLDVTVKNEDNHETNMLSSDDYNAYHGGMIAAVRSIKGSAPRSYCGDSTDRSKVKMYSVQEQTKRIFRSEAINPKFIEGMMKHGYKGALDLANYLAHSFQWDATSNVMEDWMYEKFAEKYAFDPKVQDWMKDVNPWALQRIAETLLEAEQRGFWQAKPETKEELEKIYLAIEGELEDRNDNS
ncbi:MAG TPA: cobaltochelatase subunit CobN [Candidatus Avacidaminococcus intestinavium]|uniref:Cobaltochelatase subunit CobN n=1 Tax=Candidatus Avacidaminococcus intestinavium TaxID=2840684 RepID=A0A9D1SKI3_9FIRM|nr:cobaltochelatase subunit CobN [Candidatus Avacidaminococcus intestinavium]